MVSKATIYFQVLDASGRGVPGVEVSMCGDQPSDEFSTTLALDGRPRTSGDPLTKTTDSEGVVWANVSCLYGLDDGFERLNYVTGMRFRKISCVLLAPWYVAVPRDGLRVNECYGFPPVCVPYFVADRWGGGEVPVIKRVYASVKGTSLMTFETVLCKYVTRWL